jgi:hypothetical protein
MGADYQSCICCGSFQRSSRAAPMAALPGQAFGAVPTMILRTSLKRTIDQAPPFMPQRPIRVPFVL